MAASTTIEDVDAASTPDLYRTLLLGHYMRHWGTPEYRHVLRRAADQALIELYVFAGREPMEPVRIASVGLAGQIKPDGKPEGREYFMVLPDDLGGAGRDAVLGYVSSVVVHLLAHARRSCHLPRLLGPSPLAPAEWSATALLVAEATGESEDFNPLAIDGMGEIEIEWLIPLLEAEYAFILDKGLAPFEELVQTYEQSLVDVNRSAMVPS